MDWVGAEEQARLGSHSGMSADPQHREAPRRSVTWLLPTFLAGTPICFWAPSRPRGRQTLASLALGGGLGLSDAAATRRERTKTLPMQPVSQRGSLLLSPSASITVSPLSVSLGLRLSLPLSAQVSLSLSLSDKLCCVTSGKLPSLPEPQCPTSDTRGGVGSAVTMHLLRLAVQRGPAPGPSPLGLPVQLRTE